MINVVGAGIAGSIVARLLRKKGHQVRVIDDGDRFSGSGASSNLYIASWLKKFSVDATKGIDVIESLFPASAIDQPFSKGIGDAMKVRHIAQRHLLVKPDVVSQVALMQRPMGPPVLLDGTGTEVQGPVVFCLGYRAEDVLGPKFKTDVLVGHCLLLKGRLEPGQSSLTMPLPYRHQKIYQFDDETIYFADSTRLKLTSFWGKDSGEKRKQELIKKATAALGEREIKEHRVGYRPITPGHDFGVLQPVADGMWSINGGGKNGLVAYAKLAAELSELIGAPC